MYLGIDIGGTFMKYGIIDLNGQIKAHSKVPTPHKLESLLTQIKKVTTTYQQEYTISGIGVSAPGIIQSDGFMTTGGAIHALYQINLKQKIQQITQLPTVIENDANAAAIAEHWQGNAIGIANYLCVVIGTGMGGGIIINHELYQGTHGMAGEFGYMVTKDIAKMDQVEDASLNKTATVIGGICQKYQIQSQASTLETDAKSIMKQADSGDIIARKVMEEFYTNLSVGILNLIGAFDPEIVLIGGGISANPYFWKNFQKRFTEVSKGHDSIRFLLDKTIAPVKPAKLENNAGMIGAVYQIHKKLTKKQLNPHHN